VGGGKGKKKEGEGGGGEKKKRNKQMMTLLTLTSFPAEGGKGKEGGGGEKRKKKIFAFITPESWKTRIKGIIRSSMRKKEGRKKENSFLLHRNLRPPFRCVDLHVLSRRGGKRGGGRGKEKKEKKKKKKRADL